MMVGQCLANDRDIVLNLSLGDGFPFCAPVFQNTEPRSMEVRDIVI